MEQDETYIKWFNAGAKLAQFQPELFEKLKPSLSMDKEIGQAVIDGAEEYQKGKEQTRENDLDKIRDSKEKGRDKEISR